MFEPCGKDVTGVVASEGVLDVTHDARVNGGRCEKVNINDDIDDHNNDQ